MPRVDCGFRDENGNHNPEQLALVGPTIAVQVDFDAAWQSGSKPRPDAEIFQALVDTGAQFSHIDTSLADRLALPVIDKCLVSGSGGTHEVDVYLAQIYVPAFKFTQHGRFAGADLSSGFDGHTVLLGRTFLTQFRMIYDGFSGRVTLQN
ncbi:MAG TPA: aspartyl protease family protein [Rhizomicrobium sp.]|nr:aspartyl protease family protein [Rhizomicrobium sp.]